jgi:hypothetical protein
LWLRPVDEWTQGPEVFGEDVGYGRGVVSSVSVRRGAEGIELGRELHEEGVHERRAVTRFIEGGGGLQAVGKTEELGVKVIEGVAGIIGRAGFAERVVSGVKLASRGRGETAGDPDGAERIEAVGVLNHLGFQGGGFDRGGEAVRLDAMVDGLKQAGGIAGVAQKTDGTVGGEVGSACAVGRRFGDLDAIVEVGRGDDDGDVGAFEPGEAGGGGRDTVDVREVMG